MTKLSSLVLSNSLCIELNQSIRLLNDKIKYLQTVNSKDKQAMKVQLTEEIREDFRRKLSDIESKYKAEFDQVFSLYQEIKQATMTKNTII